MSPLGLLYSTLMSLHLEFEHEFFPFPDFLKLNSRVALWPVIKSVFVESNHPRDTGRLIERIRHRLRLVPSKNSYRLQKKNSKICLALHA